jgi:hypothetical protein
MNEIKLKILLYKPVAMFVNRLWIQSWLQYLLPRVPHLAVPLIDQLQKIVDESGITSDEIEEIRKAFAAIPVAANRSNTEVRIIHL